MFTPEQAEELKKLIDENTEKKERIAHKSVYNVGRLKQSVIAIRQDMYWAGTPQGSKYWEGVSYNLATLLGYLNPWDIND